jgi:sugar lactone lactonase YvrE
MSQLISSLIVVFIMLCSAIDASSQTQSGNRKAELLVTLPDTCNTPDGMALDKDNNIILSCPNFNDTRQSGILMKIDSNNVPSLFYDLPPHPDTNKVGPMGMAFAPSGDLYVADNQYFNDKNRKSRLLRIEVKDGNPERTVVVASGLNLANAVSIRNGYVYVSETVLNEKSTPLVSGVYRFKLEEEGVLIKPDTHDSHLVATMKTYNKGLRFGADGMCFNSRGNLFVANFADGTINKLTLARGGRVVSNRLFARHPSMKSSDGLFCGASDVVYVADSLANAVFAVSPKGRVTKIAQNGNTDGADGGLDQPCEVLIRGDEMIVANFDMPFAGCVNTTFDRPYTLSRIRMVNMAVPVGRTK